MADGDILAKVNGHQAFASLSTALAEAAGDDIADALLNATNPSSGNPFATVAQAGTPTLAQVLAAGNDTGQADIVASDPSLTSASQLQMNATVVNLLGGYGDTGVAGAVAEINGGHGHAGAGIGAKVGADPGGAAGEHGKAYIRSDNTYGNAGDTLQSDATYATWQALVTTAAASPIGGGFVSVFVADTTNKILYGWTGADYTKIGDWA